MDFQEILHQQLLSNSLENYCWFFGFVIFGLLFKRIISKYLSHFMYRVLNRDKSIDIKTFDELLIKPISFFVLLMFIYLGSLNIAFPQELNFETKNFKCIFVGDASMSPYEILIQGGANEHFNQEPGQVWLERAITQWPSNVWINPTKEQHWNYSQSTHMIKEIFSDRMVPLTLKGIEEATKILSKK